MNNKGYIVKVVRRPVLGQVQIVSEMITQPVTKVCKSGLFDRPVCFSDSLYYNLYTKV